MTYEAFISRFERFIFNNKDELLKKFVTRETFPAEIQEDRQCWFPLDEELIHDFDYLDRTVPKEEDYVDDEDFFWACEAYDHELLDDWNIHVQYYNFFSVLMNEFLYKYKDDITNINFYDTMDFCLAWYNNLIKGTEFEQKLKLKPKFLLNECKQRGEAPFVEYFLFTRGINPLHNWKICDRNGSNIGWDFEEIRLRNDTENEWYDYADYVSKNKVYESKYESVSNDFKNEDELENYLTHECISRGWKCEKQSPSLYGTGVPDRKITTDTNFINYVEVKNPAKSWTLSENQVKYLDKLNKQGYKVNVAWSKEKVDEILNEIQKLNEIKGE